MMATPDFSQTGKAENSLHILQVGLIGEQVCASGAIKTYEADAFTRVVLATGVKTAGDYLGWISFDLIVLTVAQFNMPAMAVLSGLQMLAPGLPIIVFIQEKTGTSTGHFLRSGAWGCVQIDRDLENIKGPELRMIVEKLGAHKQCTQNQNKRRLDLNRRAGFCHNLEKLSGASDSPDLLAVISLEVDRFKLINECFGDKVTDSLLQQVVARLQQKLGPDSFLTHSWAGRFYFLVQGERECQSVFDFIEECLDLLASPYSIRQELVQISVSAGVSLSEGKVSAENMLAQAEMAIYKAKKLTGNTWSVCEQEMIDFNDRVRFLRNAIRQAVCREEFSLHYQPQVDAKTAQVVGNEALLRWDHPDQGAISPMEFVPVLEEMGFIEVVGEWVLYNACQQHKRWLDKGLLSQSSTISVNLSVYQLASKTLIPSISYALKESGLDPSSLILEITESMLLDPDKHLRVLMQIRKLGVKLSLDDFGTGYSTFHYLKMLDVDAIKVDRSFMKDIQNRSDHAAIVSAVLRLANDLNLSVVAEGVDATEKIDFLRSKDCTIFQGFYFSKPLPPAQLEKTILAVA